MGRAALLRRRVWWPRSSAALPSGIGADYYREMNPSMKIISLLVGLIRSNPPDQLHDETIEYRVRD